MPPRVNTIGLTTLGVSPPNDAGDFPCCAVTPLRPDPDPDVTLELAAVAAEVARWQAIADTSPADLYDRITAALRFLEHEDTPAARCAVLALEGVPVDGIVSADPDGGGR